MRLLHTADWHLGKTLKGQNLLDDQKFILNQLFEVIKDQKPDAILICGDIYDRNVPPVDAVELFNEILTKLSEKNIPTLIISGNHDSAKRLNFGSKLFEHQNIFITAKISSTPKNIVLEDNFGEIYFSMIPFFVPAEIKYKFFDKNADSPTYNDANKFYVDFARKKIPQGKRSVALAHVFISGETKTESMREIVGSAEGISAKIFSEYNYTALGHLHSPRCSGKNIFYSGSLLKYSFDEVNQKKSVNIVEIDGVGNVKTEKIDLKPRRDLIEVSGTLADFLAQPPNDAYAYITLTDEEFVYDASQKLRGVFPHFMDISNKSRPKNFIEEPTRKFRENVTLFEQFSDFFTEMTHRDLTDDEREALKEIFGG